MSKSLTPRFIRKLLKVDDEDPSTAVTQVDLPRLEAANEVIGFSARVIGGAPVRAPKVARTRHLRPVLTPPAMKKLAR